MGDGGGKGGMKGANGGKGGMKGINGGKCSGNEWGEGGKMGNLHMFYKGEGKREYG